jgi:Domain of unknown function (DUF4258)
MLGLRSALRRPAVGNSWRRPFHPDSTRDASDSFFLSKELKLHTQSVSQVSVSITKHANKRMQQRHISDLAIAIVLEYGRDVLVRGAWICVIGKKEIERSRRHGIDLSAYAGVHVVLSEEGGSVMTVYRNGDFRRLRAKSRRQRRLQPYPSSLPMLTRSSTS